MTNEEAIAIEHEITRMLVATVKEEHRERVFTAHKMAIEALEKMNNTNHLCIRCANNREGCCPSQDVIACGDFKECDTE